MQYPDVSRPSRAKGEKLALRLSHILALLHQGDVIDKYQLALDFQVDVRTIERDLGQRLRSIAERGDAGRWQLTQAARSTIPATQLHGYTQLLGAQDLFPDSSLRYLLAQIETPAHLRAIQVQPMPHEDLRPHCHVFGQLQGAIEQRQECHFVYKGKLRHAQPYRLIHRNGVWYLAAEEAGHLKNFSLTLVQELCIDNVRSFTPKSEHLAYINAKDDVWFTTQTTEVLLRVSPQVAHYFTRRDLLPRQQHSRDTDGSLVVTTLINHINQLLPVVRYWLPHVRIVRPDEWHRVLVQDLHTALQLWEP